MDIVNALLNTYEGQEGVLREIHQDFEAEKNIGNRYDLHIRPVGSFGSEGTIAMQPDPSLKAKRRDLMMASVPMAKDPVCGMMVDPLSAAGTIRACRDGVLFLSSSL